MTKEPGTATIEALAQGAGPRAVDIKAFTRHAPAAIYQCGCGCQVWLLLENLRVKCVRCGHVSRTLKLERGSA